MEDDVTESKRLFVAIDVPEQALDELVRIQSRLEKSIANGGRLIPPSQLHLTLLFMPAVPDAIVPAVIRSITSVAERTAPIPLALSEIGAFPSAAAARIIWVGIEAAQGGLYEVQRALAAAVGAMGIVPPDSRFVPHVTILRANRRSRMRLSTIRSGSIPVNQTPWQASSIKLFHSAFSSGGHSHCEIACFSLLADSHSQR